MHKNTNCVGSPAIPSQVILSGNAHHSVPEQQVAAAATSTIVGLGPNGTAQLTALGQAHPLRVYWEYLSYTFR